MCSSRGRSGLSGDPSEPLCSHTAQPKVMVLAEMLWLAGENVLAEKH